MKKDNPFNIITHIDGVKINKTMKTYKVGVYKEEGGYYFINAENEEKAREIAEEQLYNCKEFDKTTTGSREVLLILLSDELK